MAKVIWERSDGTEIGFPIVADAVIGRDASADCKLEARGVSRRHASIEARDDGYFLSDLGSTNGTALNGQPVVGSERLSTGDRISLGSEMLRFESDLEPQATRSALATEPLSRTIDREKRALDPTLRIRELPEALPRRVGKFELLERLGQGGMGAVYRAHDADSDREVAVKLIRQNIGRKEAFLQFFHHREAVLAREINHPNVITVYEHGVEADQHYISMEFVRGLSLYQLLKARGSLSPREVLELLRQVACGLAAAHRQGVVHSDIKPANILVLGGEVFASSPSAEEDSSEEEEDAANNILEFEDDTKAVASLLRKEHGRDEALKAEIRRRSIASTLDLLVDPPFFQRPSEMRFLEHYLDRAASGRGAFVLVEGETGSGKRRLVSEFVERQRKLDQIDLHDLDCTRIEGIPELFARLCPDSILARGSKREMVDALKARLESVERPILLRVLEIGKATPLACELLSGIAAAMDARPILVVACLDREDLRGNDSLKVLIELLAQNLRELYVRPLTAYQIQRYLEILFPDHDCGGRISSDLFRLSGGNLTRLLDLTRSFFERGILRLDPVQRRLLYRPKQKELELEEGKNLYEKFRSYGKVEQRVLTMAAFIGDRFFFDVLLRMTDLDETTLFFLVRQFLADGILTEEGRSWHGFTNVAFQHYVSERVPPPERPHLHRKIARLLVSVPVPESAELYRLRARHYLGCREHAKAMSALLEGAHLARSAYKVDLARELYQEMLRLYRGLGNRAGPRKEVTAILRDWFRRDGNWYEVLGDKGAEEVRATVKIADFGISFRVADEERGYAVGRRPALGTPRYLAPERGKGEAGGPLSDIFSLGVIAYETVVGAAPFPGLKGIDVIRALAEQPIRIPARFLEGYPDGFGRLVDTMVAIDPARRWSAERIIRELVKLQYDLRTGVSGVRGGA